jgi:Leucine-rich repeat (LRR) protein
MIGTNNFLVFPESVTALATVKNLNLNGSYFPTIPESIGDMHALKNINLQWNDQLKTLPEQLKHRLHHVHGWHSDVDE